MSESVPKKRAGAKQIRYEVSTSNDVINLQIRNGASELSASTDRQGALMLATDILMAVDTTTDTLPENDRQFMFGDK